MKTHPRIHASTHPRIHASTHPRIHASTHPRIHALRLFAFGLLSLCQVKNLYIKKSKIVRFSVYFLCFWFAPHLQAQQLTDLIQYKKRTEIGFDSAQEQKLNRIISNPLYKAHYYVNFQDLATHHVDGVIMVNLPSTVNSFLSPGSTDIDGDGVLVVIKKNKKQNNSP